MTSKSPRKTVDAFYWEARLRTAKDFLAAARQAETLAEPGQGGNPVISLIVLAAIAFGDALTAKRARVINQQDHAAAPKLLRGVLQNTLPDAQERRYRRILASKDEAQYGARIATMDDARRLLTELDEFARWAADLL